MNEWHPTKNKSLSPSCVYPKSQTLVWWKCQDCDYEYLMLISARTEQKQNCPRCKANNKLFKGYNDLETWCKQNNRLDFLEEWDYEKNNIFPSDITAHNDNKVWWKCKVCGQSYQCNVAHHTAETSGCPICAGRRAVKCVETGVEYAGPTEAAKTMFNDNKKRKGIVKCCKGKQHTCGGYHWEYVDKEDKENNSNV